MQVIGSGSGGSVRLTCLHPTALLCPLLIGWFEGDQRFAILREQFPGGKQIFFVASHEEAVIVEASPGP